MPTGPARSSHPLEAHFREAVGSLRRDEVEENAPGVTGGGSAVRGGSGLSLNRCLELFDAQIASRLCDLAAQWMHSRGRGYYPIGSSGHEGNAAVAAALRVDDPAFLHYRSGAFYITGARQLPGQGPGAGHAFRRGGRTAGADRRRPPQGLRASGPGRHPIDLDDRIAPPRAVGVAFAIERARKLGHRTPWPADAVCSLGDASINTRRSLAR